MRRLAIVLSAVALVFGAVSFAGATSVDFEIGTKNGIKFPAGLVEYEIYGTLPDVAFSLEQGESKTFNYALVTKIGAVLVSYDITGFLDFDQPADTVVANPGTLTIASSTTNCGGGKGGGGNCKKTWNISIGFNSVDVPFGNGGWFTVLLSGVDATWTGKCCSPPESWERTITATVTLKTPPTPTPIPEPSTLLLLGSGILGAMAFLRRRRN